MRRKYLTRRATVGAIASGLAGGMAGCTDSQPSGDEETTDGSSASKSSATSSEESMPSHEPVPTTREPLSALPSDPVSGTWPVEHYDSHNSRHATVNGPQSDPELAWHISGVSNPPPSPLIGSGLSYVVDASDSKYVGVDLSSGRRVDAGVLASRPGRTYFIAVTETVAYALGGPSSVDLFDVETGSRRATAELERLPHIWPTVTADGMIVPTGEGGSLASIDATGTVRWEFKRFGPILRHPVVLDELVVAAAGEVAYGIDRETGSQQWGFKPEPPVSSPPVVAGDHVVLAHEDGTVQAINRDGTQQWRRTPLESGRHSMAVDDTTVYVGTDDGIVVISDGPEITRLTPSNELGPVETVTLGSQLLYAVHGEFSQLVSAIDPETETVQWTHDFGSSIDSDLAIRSGPRIAAGTALFTLFNRSDSDADKHLVALAEP